MTHHNHGAEREITPEMMQAAYAVWNKYGVRDVLEIDSDIMRETLAAVLSVSQKGKALR